MTSTVETGPKQSSGSVWPLLVGIIDKPTVTFKTVLARRSWWRWALPLLVLMLTFGVVSVLSLPYTQELAREQAEQQLASMPAEQADAARAAMERSRSYPILLASTLGFGILALLIGVVAQATFLYFSALMAGGDDMEFGSVFAVSAWTRLPMAIGLLVQAGFIVATRQMIRYPGLSFLVATGDLLKDARNPLIPLLGRIDLFWLWHLFLVVIGVSVAARFGRGKSLVLTIIYGVLVLAVAALPSLIFAGMMPG